MTKAQAIRHPREMEAARPLSGPKSAIDLEGLPSRHNHLTQREPGDVQEELLGLEAGFRHLLLAVP